MFCDPYNQFPLHVTVRKTFASTFLCVLTTLPKICFIMKEAARSDDYLAGRWISTRLSPAGFVFNSSISNPIICNEPNAAVLIELLN